VSNGAQMRAGALGTIIAVFAAVGVVYGRGVRMPTSVRGGTPFNDDFQTNMTAWWEYTDDVMQTPPFRALPSLCSLNASLATSPDWYGLIASNSDAPCPSQCSGAASAACHLQGLLAEGYGELDVTMRAAYNPDNQGPPPSNTLSCVSLYTDTPQWNEIDLCFIGNQLNYLQCYIYIDGNLQPSSANVELPFDPTAGFHRYTVNWTPTSVTWSVDGAVIHTATTGIPWESTLTVRIIVRPLTAFEGEAHFAVARVAFIPS
jgi:Glycosyl hydrolases family 16